MSDNLINFKKRVRPDDYTNGPVKVFSKDELDDWTRTRYDEVWPRIEAQMGLSEADIKYLDSMKLMQAELDYAEVMEGTSEGGQKKDV
jgi:hypothetical protein